jgi:hypothetical protein
MAVEHRDQPVTGIDVFHIRIGIIAVFGQNLGPALVLSPGLSCYKHLCR